MSDTYKLTKDDMNDIYSQWLDNAMAELRALEYSQGDIDSFDICEDGLVYMGNMGMFNGVTSLDDYISMSDN